MGTAAAIWPPTLPRAPLQDTLREIPPELVIATAMDAGPAKLRRRFTSAPRRFHVEFHLTRAQKAIFEAFVYNAIAGGALPYQWTSPATGLVADFRILSRSMEHAAMTPRLDGNRDYWHLSMDVEELPGTSEVCEIVTIAGTLGTFTIAQTSILSTLLTARCFNGAAFTGGGSVTRTFTFWAYTDDAVLWQYSAGGFFSRIRLHADLGWAFSIYDGHYPATSCGMATRVAPGAFDETAFPLMRHYGYPEIGPLASPNILCTGGASASAWFKAIDCRLWNTCAPALVPERMTGFRFYSVLCVLGGGPTTDPTEDTEGGLEAEPSPGSPPGPTDPWEGEDPQTPDPSPLDPAGPFGGGIDPGPPLVPEPSVANP